MKLINKSSSTVTTNTFEIDPEDGSKKITYIEYLNDKGRVIDENLRDSAGSEIDDPALLEVVQEFVDSN